MDAYLIQKSIGECKCGPFEQRDFHMDNTNNDLKALSENEMKHEIIVQIITCKTITE